MKPDRERAIRAGTGPVGWEGWKNRQQRLTQAERKVLFDLDTMIAITARYRMIDTRHIITTATCRTKEVLSPYCGPSTHSLWVYSTQVPLLLSAAYVPRVLQRVGQVGTGREDRMPGDYSMLFFYSYTGQCWRTVFLSHSPTSLQP